MEQNFDLEKLQDILAILSADPNVQEFEATSKYDTLSDSDLFVKKYTDDFRLISSISFTRFESKEGNEYLKYNIVFKIPVVVETKIVNWRYFSLGIYAGFETRCFFEEHQELDKKKYILPINSLNNLMLTHLKVKNKDNDFWRADFDDVEAAFSKYLKK